MNSFHWGDEAMKAFKELKKGHDGTTYVEHAKFPSAI